MAAYVKAHPAPIVSVDQKEEWVKAMLTLRPAGYHNESLFRAIDHWCIQTNSAKPSVNVSDTVALYGGKTIAVNKEPSALHGSVDIDASVIQEWPSLEAAQAWLDSPEYAPLKQLRDDRALSDLKIIPVPALS